jgi:hypothetical protein
MIGIFVKRDLVAVPQPVIAEGEVVGGDSEVEATEPEALPVSSLQSEDVAAAKATGEAPVFLGMLEVIMRVIAAGIVSHPATVRTDVGSGWMPGVIA